MKKLFVFIGLITVMACEKAPEAQLAQPESGVNGDAQSRQTEERIGKMVYNHIKIHLGDLDPFVYFSPQQAVKMRKSFDSLQTIGATNADVVLDNLSRSARIGNSSALTLKQYLKTVSRHYTSISETTLEAEDKWFNNQQELTRARQDLDEQTKTNLLFIGAITKYATKAMLESLPKPDSKPGARPQIDGGCLQALSECATNNIVNYIGFGSGLGSAAAGVGALPGAVAGAVIGIARSIQTCSCAQSTPCTYPRAVTTPPVCYNPSAGIDIRVLGYGDNPAGFELEVWDNPQRSGNTLLSPIQSVSTGNVFHISDANLQGKRLIYVRPITNCAGDSKLAPEMVEINIDNLGKPDFVVTGPQNPVRGSQITVYAVGPYTNGYNLQWYMPAYYGQILSTNGAYNSAFVQLNGGGGYGYVSASLTESCGSLTQRYEYSAQ